VSEWRRFLGTFHADRAGITERVLRHGAVLQAEDPYGWLAAAVRERTGPGALVVDVGCGSAPLHALLPGRRWVGLDPAPAELALASARGAEPLLRADAAALPVADGVADAVVYGMALQVVTPLDRALEEAWRVLRPGGVLAALVPAVAPLTSGDRLRYARLLLALRRTSLPYPNPDAALAAALESAGFAVRVDARRRVPFPVRDPQDGVLLVRSLYLPRVAEARVRAAEHVAEQWRGATVGVPLRLLVARRAP